MPDQTEQFKWVLKLSRVALIFCLVLTAVLMAVAVVWTVRGVQTEPADWLVVVLRGVGALACLALGAGLFIAVSMVQAVISSERSAATTANHIHRLETLMDDLAASGRKLTDLMTLSDQAKSLLFRDREIEALREAIHDDIMRQDHQTAMSLIETVEKRFGYADEAARLRRELEDSKKATLQQKIETAVQRVRTFLEGREWSRAMRETQRILAMFPNDPKIAALPDEIEAARARHKRDLLQAYGDAVRKNDVDRGVNLLRQLDVYLSPQEAAALQESARGVLKAKLLNLGVQFAIRVTDGQWADAVAVGEEIIRGYPNSKMAQEVREKMDLLRARAGQADVS